MSLRIRVCDVALAVLRETNNPAVMWGDCGLLDTIYVRAGLKETRYVPVRWSRVMNALTRQPGELVPGYTLIGPKRYVRIFWLPGHEPSRMRQSTTQTG